VNEQSATRRELEASIRALLPERGTLGGLDTSQALAQAHSGRGGLGRCRHGLPVGANQGTPGPQEAPPLILRRLLRIVATTSLVRAWTKKSPKWLSVVLGLVLFRFIGARSARSKRHSAGKSNA
jgi:hypothetical protein